MVKSLVLSKHHDSSLEWEGQLLSKCGKREVRLADQERGGQSEGKGKKKTRHSLLLGDPLLLGRWQTPWSWPEAHLQRKGTHGLETAS